MSKTVHGDAGHPRNAHGASHQHASSPTHHRFHDETVHTEAMYKHLDAKYNQLHDHHDTGKIHGKTATTGEMYTSNPSLMSLDKLDHAVPGGLPMSAPAAVNTKADLARTGSHPYPTPPNSEPGN